MSVPSDHDIIMALGEDLPVGLWVARAPGGEHVYANRTFAEIMGMGPRGDTKVGGYSEPYGILTRDGRPYPEHLLPFTRALEEKRVVVVDDITIGRPDGTRVDVRAFARPVIDEHGAITHVIIAFFDITREVEAERARAESETRLQRAQRLEAIGTLAGGIAHDFNNLIFGIKLIAAELASGEADADRKHALQLIDEITDRSAGLTRSLLGFARLGKHRSAPVALSRTVAAMRELLTRTSTGIELEFDLVAADGGAVIGDESQLEQVVMNLVVNARDAVDGKGRIVVRTTTAELPTGRCVVLEVCDDGPGIPPELRDHVFEPYFTTKTKGPDRGTGLGLATVFGIVDAHGGTIEIDRGLDGRGTTMRIHLPAAHAVDRAAPGTVQPAPQGSGMILVIDDDAIVRHAVAVALGGLGYHTAEAASGADAVEIYRAHASEIHAVVLDMVMPGMSGRATYLGLREINPDVPVLLISGYTFNEEVQSILDLGVRGFVSKPHSIDDLGRAVARVLGR